MQSITGLIFGSKDGGWGVDALLGTQTRVHNDIDLFVEKSIAKIY